MNAVQTCPPVTDARSAALPASTASSTSATRQPRRARDFGVGYGNSSGYASTRQYASNWGQPRLRCA